MSPIALALIFATAAAAQAPAADPREAAGVAAFETGDYQLSRKLLLELVEDASVPEPAKAGPRVQLAASYHQLGELAAARAQLGEVVKRHPGLRPDPALFSPEFLQLFEQVRAQAAPVPAPPAAVRIEPSAPAPIAPWVATAGAGVAAAVSAGFLASGLGRIGEINAYRVTPVPAAEAWTREEALRRGRAADRDLTVALVSGVACATLTSAAVYLWVSR